MLLFYLASGILLLHALYFLELSLSPIYIDVCNLFFNDSIQLGFTINIFKVQVLKFNYLWNLYSNFQELSMEERDKETKGEYWGREE